MTRPLEDGPAIADQLRTMGHDPVLAPLLTLQFIDGPEPDFAGVQAILTSSANGIRALARRTARRDLAVFAVGPQTAQEAANAGFTTIKNADGDAKALAQAAARWTTPDNGALLHACGEDAAGALGDDLAARGFTVQRAVLYRMVAASQLPGDVREAFATLDAVLFFSPRTAKIFGALTQGLSLQKLVALCISPATAKAADPLDFAEIRIAAKPNQAAMLALVE